MNSMDDIDGPRFVVTPKLSTISEDDEEMMLHYKRGNDIYHKCTIDHICLRGPM